MARTIEEIRNQMLSAKESEPGLASLSSASKTSIWRLLINVVAMGHQVNESLFDLHETEVQDIITNSRPLYIPELIRRIKNFQFGHDLIPEDVEYDNTGLDDEEIEASRVVKHCAITELRRGLRIKVAGESSSGILQPLTPEQEAALHEYIRRVRPFVPFKLTNQEPDSLYLNLKIYYNPLVLDASGKRLDGSNDTPVQDSINNYLKNLPFNGRFIIAKMLDDLQATDGITIPHCESAMYQYADTELLPIGIYCIPDAGYLNLTGLTIEYIADELI